jgi:nitroreductase
MAEESQADPSPAFHDPALPVDPAVLPVLPVLPNRHPAADQVLDAIATTRAMRRYTADPVDEADLARILFAASRAPSGSNRQGFRFVVLRDGERARQAKGLMGTVARDIWQAKRRADGYDEGSGVDPSSPKGRMAATMEQFVADYEQIPVVVLVTSIRHRSGPEETIGASVYPACQNLLLAARALGYGATMMTWHRAVESELREVLGIPDDVFLAAVVALGVPEGHQGPVRRAPLRHLVYDGSWGHEAEWAVDPPGTSHTSWRRR